MKIWAVAGALLVFLAPQAAEAKRGGGFSSGAGKSSAPAASAKPAAPAAAKPATATPSAAAPSTAPAAPSQSIWSSSARPNAAPAAAPAGGRSGGFVFISAGGGSAAAKEQQPGQGQAQPMQQRAPGSPLIQPASASADESILRTVPVPVMGQAQAAQTTARAPAFEVVR